jgi:hypothetical protein
MGIISASFTESTPHVYGNKGRQEIVFFGYKYDYSSKIELKNTNLLCFWEKSLYHLVASHHFYYGASYA